MVRPRPRRYYGICIHSTFRSSPQYGNDDATLDLVVASGARYVRDLLSVGWYGGQQAELWGRYVDAGIRGFHATAGIYGKTEPRDEGVRADTFERLLASADDLVEVTGWNEPDGDGRHASEWLPETVAWQRWLYLTIKETPELAHIRVGLGAIRAANPQRAATQLKYLRACEGFFDFADLHIYPGPTAAVEEVIEIALHSVPSAPVIVSEFGGSTANMSLERQAEICTTGLAYLTEKRVPTYIYELWDDPGPAVEANFGIYTAEGEDKPAVVALRELVGC